MLRELALSHLEWAGIRVDPAANDATVRGRSGEVQAPGSRVKVRAQLPCRLASRCAMHAWRLCKGRVSGSPLLSSPRTAALPPNRQVLVIPTDEQLEIAEQTLAVVRRHSGQMAAAA